MSQKMLYKRLILPLGICMGSQGRRGNKRLLQTAGMLHATTFIHQTRESLSQGFQQRLKGKRSFQITKLQIQKKTLSLDGMVYRENRKLKKKT